MFLSTLKVFVLLIMFSQCAHAQLSVSSPVNMSFGQIEFSAGGGQNDVFLGSNGTVTYTGNFTGRGFGTPGELLITGPIGTTVEIACLKDLNISNGASTIDVDQIEYAIGVANGAAFGSGIECRGSRKFDGVHVITGNSVQDTLVIGGRIRTSVSSVSDGSWSSTNAGGNGVTFVVLVQ